MHGVNKKLTKTSNIINGTVTLPGSKSISNRILLIKELAQSTYTINNLSLSDDTQRLSKYINMISTCGKSGIPMIIDADNAGTVARFLTAFLVYREGTWLITGNKRMQNRPIKALVDGLQLLKSNITYVKNEGFLPIIIKGSDIKGGKIEIDASESSQFVSAIMLIAPYLYEGLKIRFTGNIVSLPYIEMTQKLMQKFGAYVEVNSEEVHILNRKYQFHECTVEADWSSASYWYQVVAIANNATIKINGLNRNSLQGDSVIAEIYEQLGVKTIFDANGITITKSLKVTSNFSYNFNGCPDLVPAVMATCAALSVKSTFKNIAHLAFKESNRIKALAEELKKIGASLNKYKQSYVLTPNKTKVNDKLKFSSHGDHRIAMSMAPLVLKYNNVEICNCEVVKKSYPEYWNELEKLNFASFN